MRQRFRLYLLPITCIVTAYDLPKVTVLFFLVITTLDTSAQFHFDSVQKLFYVLILR